MKPLAATALLLSGCSHATPWLAQRTGCVEAYDFGEDASTVGCSDPTIGEARCLYRVVTPRGSCNFQLARQSCGAEWEIEALACSWSVGDPVPWFDKWLEQTRDGGA